MSNTSDNIVPSMLSVGLLAVAVELVLFARGCVDSTSYGIPTELKSRREMIDLARSRSCSSQHPVDE